MKIYCNNEFAVSFDIDNSVLFTHTLESVDSIQLNGFELENPDKSLLDKLVEGFGVLTEGDTALVKAKKWGLISDLYVSIGLPSLYGFKYNGFEIANPFTTENGMDTLSNPEEYYGEHFVKWLERFEHGVDTFPWPMLETFEDSSWHNDVCPSIFSESLDLQVFVANELGCDREESEIPRIKVIRASRYGENTNCLMQDESYLTFLEFLKSV